MKLVFGLGNPGAEYENTYHNAGLLALAYLENKFADGNPLKIKHEDSFWYKKYGDFILAGPGPNFFMNESVIPARAALAYFKLKPEDLIVLHDDSDLFLGDWKFEKERGAAGHHGVESIIQELGTQDFWRGRVGIRPEEKDLPRKKAEEFVLKNISAIDQEILAKAYEGLATKLIEKL